MYDPLEYWEARAEEWIRGDYPTGEWWKVLEPYVDPSWNVLELGCGEGRWSPFFPNYTGSEISPTLLAHCMEKYPDKDWAHHDMRQGVSGKEWDLIFTFTAWLHVPPGDMAKVRLPDCNYLFVEPHGISLSEHCFRHDYGRLFGTKKLKTIGKLTLNGRIK